MTMTRFMVALVTLRGCGFGEPGSRLDPKGQPGGRAHAKGGHCPNRMTFVIAVLLLTPILALAQSLGVRPGVLAKKPVFSYTSFVRSSTPSSINHYLELDGRALRGAVNKRPITKLRVFAKTPNEQGVWEEIELGPDPSYKNLEDSTRLNFGRSIQLPKGLSDVHRAKLDQGGAAYRAEVTTSDGKVAQIDLQEFGRNVLPNNHGRDH
jgi:hypothetical protein